jgi:enamine deaminase RidA (YjgF/YER057c/UK114 family)
LSDELAGLGGSIANVVRITVYLLDLAEYGEFASLRGEYFRDYFPASTAIKVAGLIGDALIEVDAIAFLPE